MTNLQVGRVMFSEDGASTEWKLQTLRNHVGNVTALTKLWNNQRAFAGYPSNLQKSRKLVIDAAEIHDMGKPQRFRLLYQPNKFNPDKWEWSYSFKAHRFDARHENDYVEKLAILHHEYSVEGITKAIAELRLHEADEIRQIADNLPLDLYALEMCDQIEATVACSVLGDKDVESRVFMDFEFEAVEDNCFLIDPFPFGEGETVSLQMEYALVVPDASLVEQIMNEQTDDNNRQRSLRQLQKKLLEALRTAPLQYQEVTLCPWI